MSESRRELLQDARRLIEQEQVWDDMLLNTASAAAPTLVPSGPASDKTGALQALYEQYKGCQACPLGATRIRFVFGVGDPGAKVLFIGEGPGFEEDRKGEPFVGKAGQLLDKIMAAIGLDRTNAYIANIVKCHPMQNPATPEARGNDRPPTAEEVEKCLPILRQQIALLRPAFIVTLGSPSTRTILQTSEGISRIRGELRPLPLETLFAGFPMDEPLRAALSAIQVLPTYHPAALLRNPDLKKDVWTDMKRLRDLLQAVPA